MKPVIYQLVVRYFGNTNVTNTPNGDIATNGCGKFADINDRALQSLRDLGVTHLWLTGIIRQATLTDYSNIGLPADPPDVVKGIAGSFYAIRDYYDVCPDYAIDPVERMREFEDLVGRIHAAGLIALIDLVPNHVSRAYSSGIMSDTTFGLNDQKTTFFHPQNNFFYLVDPPHQALRLSKPPQWNPPGAHFTGIYGPEDGSPDYPPKASGDNVTTPNPSVDNWYETIKLNYGFDFTTGQKSFDPIPATWLGIDRILAYWQAKGVDGFRCDFAHYVPAEAWHYLIAQARERRLAYFFAEAYFGWGGNDPVASQEEMIDAGIDTVYHYQSYNALKQVYRGEGVETYDSVMVGLSDRMRSHVVNYLENHDERRVASPIMAGRLGESGFGSAEAGYQLAPLQFLSASGAVLLLNGQEVGEPGAGMEGFGGGDGRTTFFDYWAMPEFVKWVGSHSYDGAALSGSQKALRRFYAALLNLCQSSCVKGSGYWGLRYFNNPQRFADCPADLYSFARFEPKSGKALLVVANFRGNEDVSGRLRLPEDLVARIGLLNDIEISLVLDRDGSKSSPTATLNKEQIMEFGFAVTIANQTSHVYSIKTSPESRRS